MLQPGKYKAKVTSWGVIPSKKDGSPIVALEFTTTDTRETIKDYGYLTAKAKPTTLKRLITAGFILNQVSDLAQGNAVKAFDGREVEIEVEAYSYPKDGEMKSGIRVKYINPIGPRQLKNTMDAGLAKAAIGDTSGELMMLRKEMGEPAKKEIKNYALDIPADEPLPF